MENGKHSFDYDYFVTNMRKHLPAGEVMFLSTVTEESYVCDEEEKAFVQYRINTHMITNEADIRFKFEDLINAYGNMEGFWEGKKNIFPM